MSALPFIHFYPSDWLGGTRGLSATETGVYITLVCMMYEREEPLDMDEDRLARLCGATPAAFRKALRALMAEGKIVRRGGGLWQPRVEKELKKRSERSDNARVSANARWQKAKENQAPDDTPAMQLQCADDANQKPEARLEDAGASSSGPRKRGARLPADWTLPDDWRDWAVSEHGMSTEAVVFEAAKFRDYWHSKAGRDAAKLDWAATWRNWCRTASPRRATQPATVHQLPRVRAKLPEGFL